VIPSGRRTPRGDRPDITSLLRNSSVEAGRMTRRSRSAPLVELPVGAKCDGILSVSAADLPFRQKLTGTTAWRKS
jgi:hypothetical protein